MKKMFFYRIDVADLMDFATDPEGAEMSLLQFAKELNRGSSDFKFIQRIIDEASAFSQAKSDAGKKGMKKRWVRNVTEDNTVITDDNSVITKDNTAITEDSSVITEVSTPVTSSSNSNSNSNRQKKKRKKPPQSADAFELFWSAYPRKTAKHTARRAFAKVDAGDVPNLMSALEACKATRQWQDNQFVPHASTWLNQRRWEDDIDNATKPHNNSMWYDMGLV